MARGQLTLLGGEDLAKMSMSLLALLSKIWCWKLLTGTYLSHERRQTPQNLLFSTHASSAVLRYQSVAKGSNSPTSFTTTTKHRHAALTRYVSLRNLVTNYRPWQLPGLNLIMEVRACTNWRYAKRWVLIKAHFTPSQGAGYYGPQVWAQHSADPYSIRERFVFYRWQDGFFFWCFSNWNDFYHQIDQGRINGKGFLITPTLV